MQCIHGHTLSQAFRGMRLLTMWMLCLLPVAGTELVCLLCELMITVTNTSLVAMPTEPFTSSSKLRFRGIPDSLAEHHLEGCECCLIHADNPLTKTRGVYLNPHVRVGYNSAAYKAVHPEQGAWVSTWQIFSGLWINRIMRWVSAPFDSLVVRKRVAAWEKEGIGRREPGEFCLINEMQVLVERGWAHV